jgi:hypothetical protein
MRYIVMYRVTRNAIKYLLEDTKGSEYVGEISIEVTYKENVT